MNGCSENFMLIFCSCSSQEQNIQLVQSPDHSFFSVAELSNLTSKLNISWLQVINTQLLKHSKISETDLILVENSVYLRELSELVSKTSKK